MQRFILIRSMLNAVSDDGSTWNIGAIGIAVVAVLLVVAIACIIGLVI